MREAWLTAVQWLHDRGWENRGISAGFPNLIFHITTAAFSPRTSGFCCRRGGERPCCPGVCSASAPLAGQWEGHERIWRKRRIKGRERGREVTGAMEEAEPHGQKLTPKGKGTILLSPPDQAGGSAIRGLPGEGGR